MSEDTVAMHDLQVVLKQLNDEQMMVYDSSVSGSKITLLHGSPGTRKAETIVHVEIALALLKPKASILTFAARGPTALDVPE